MYFFYKTCLITYILTKKLSCLFCPIRFDEPGIVETKRCVPHRMREEMTEKNRCRKKLYVKIHIFNFYICIFVP